ncbi:MAG TPA: hypothetical protein DCG57_21915 [Candidatus Riflebacteria bacterium]|nr:hypothetical protein [Candidatus Riflebacteria bacterium]
MISGVLKANELSEVGALIHSEKALLMIERDVYWPKWDSPWWYILLLEETGRLAEVPVEAFKELLTCADRQYLKVFPVREEDVDGPVNGHTEVMCFCFFGALLKVASKLDFDVFAHLPWAKTWLSRYQLPDGGYNCDESAYTGSGKSSLVSSTVMLEGMIEYARFTKDIETFAPNMQKIVSYLLKHQVYMSTAGKEIPDTDWDKIIFPRFYEFDFSRGLEAIFDFLLLTGKKVRGVAVERALALLRKKTDAGLAHSEKQWLSDEKTVSYYIEKPIVFQDMANVPLVMKKLYSASDNEFVPALLARISRKHEEVKSRGLIV